MRLLDFRRYRRSVTGLAGREHVCLDLGGEPLRLDVIEGSVLARPVQIQAVIELDEELSLQIASIRRIERALRGMDASYLADSRARRLVLALRALDAKASGASLRDIARSILGCSDWPGDGEHAKSSARRLAGLGMKLVRGGPVAILGRHI